MAEEYGIALGIIVRAFDEYTVKMCRGYLGSCFSPDDMCARTEGYRIRFHVTEDEDFLPGVVGADEEGGAVDYSGDVILLAIEGRRTGLRGLAEDARAALRVDGCVFDSIIVFIMR